jgi:hypothetical protein
MPKKKKQSRKEKTAAHKAKMRARKARRAEQLGRATEAQQEQRDHAHLQASIGNTIHNLGAMRGNMEQITRLLHAGVSGEADGSHARGLALFDSLLNRLGAASQTARRELGKDFTEATTNGHTPRTSVLSQASADNTAAAEKTEEAAQGKQAQLDRK